ncbi:hypothetical protein WMY93_014887 [Mugilogobius chulae]|uniref:NAD(P)(+)--arginine ADP-ribosyltransferase n=1 Tax=Mugilogobius chulae TaxID=88201 RepID=A0AAW0P6I8_9GOBI
MLGFFVVSTGFTQEPLQSSTIELSMMDECIDDMFNNCIKEMEEQVQKIYFPRELKNENFKMAWDLSEDCAKQRLQRMQRKYSGLTINHTRAICVYTEEEPNMYVPLNAALRRGAAKYNTTDFQYHALYFWLTTALQILKSSNTAYRKTWDVYNGQVNQTIRFGYFASSSLKPDLSGFGNTTCFHIKTQLGAYIEDHSAVKGEDEVLIPSYEKFKIIKIVPDSYGELNCTKSLCWRV